MAELEAILRKLDLMPEEASLVRQALTHSSFNSNACHSTNQGGEKPVLHNERLEYLGDAVLELAISDYLYHKHLHLPEGELTRLRANLVRESTLVSVAKELGLGEHLKMSKGTKAIPSILADALEALVGAIFISRGYEEARVMVYRWFKHVFADLEKGNIKPDYKTYMQEYAQEKFAIIPEYKIVAEQGPDHDKTFTAQFILHKEIWASGSGKSKKEAEQEAARGAYQKIHE